MPSRILMIEDDDRIRETTRFVLEDEGFAFEGVESGEEAMKIFGLRPPDCVLVDLMLPGMDGFETCRGLRQRSDVPIIMVTARADTFDVVAGLEAGADDYLTKPFEPKELTARIRALLRRTKARSRPPTAIVLGDLEVRVEEG
ncbi:MAG: response regulator, partial [Actinomycetota bacterium]